MLESILGIILLFIPFVLVDLFSDKIKGFIYILFCLLSFHVVLAFSTQLMGVFYYPVVLVVTSLADLILLAIYIKIKKGLCFNFLKIDLIALAVIVIACGTLYQVHYNYTGKISLATDTDVVYHDVENMEYGYPYFSDEWYSISLIEGSIYYHGLPIRNLLNNGFFTNLEMFTHSFLAELMLILGLDPLTQYTILSIFINVLIIILAYSFLRIAKIPKLSSAIAALAILYISCGADSPGIWNLVPVTLGMLFILIGLCFMEMEDIKMVFLSFAVVSIFYPLFMPFYGLGILIFLFSNVKSLKENKFKVLGWSILSLLVAIPVILFILFKSPLADQVRYILSRLYYISFTGNFIPYHNIFDIIPLPIILVSLIVIPFFFRKKKWLAWQLVLGIFYWCLYSFINYRIVIEFERVIFFTSIIICLMAGFGLYKLVLYIGYKWVNYGTVVAKYGQMAVIVLFLLMIPYYTQSNNWQKTVYINIIDQNTAYPRAPANNYLTQDDIRVFKNIRNKIFLSIPWKGTVIGVATGNYPVVIKQGTISLGPINTPGIFWNANCQDKMTMAKDMNLDYVYIYPFDCAGFEKVDQSTEGFVLYKVNFKNGN